MAYLVRHLEKENGVNAFSENGVLCCIQCSKIIDLYLMITSQKLLPFFAHRCCDCLGVTLT